MKTLPHASRLKMPSADQKRNSVQSSKGSPLGILHFDRDGVITACNEPFIDIIGSSAGEVVGLDMLRDLMDQFVVNAVKEALSGRVGY